VKHDLTVPPWQTTAARLVYAHPQLCLVEYQILRADGRPALRHRLTESASVRVVAVDPGGLLALIWRWRYALSQRRRPATRRTKPPTRRLEATRRRTATPSTDNPYLMTALSYQPGMVSDQPWPRLPLRTGRAGRTLCRAVASSLAE